MEVTADRLKLFLAHIDATLGDNLTPWPGGQPDEIEIALLNAVFSARARFGKPASNKHAATGVYAVMDRWREHRGTRADDLRVLAATPAADVATIVENQSKLVGRTKASIVIEVAGVLVSVGIVRGSDFGAHEGEAVQQVLRVRGFGETTWHYLRMLLGNDDSKPDVMVQSFAHDALGESLDAETVRRLVLDAAQARDVRVRSLDHSIWRYQREHRRVQGAAARRTAGPVTADDLRATGELLADLADDAIVSGAWS